MLSRQFFAVNPPPVSIADLRKEYSRQTLRRAGVEADPVRQFARWMGEAVAAELTDPNAMCLATADAAGQPSARTVLLKGFDERGFVFFTNYESRKGRELDANPRAALNILWQELERQVCITGGVGKISRGESEAYFHSRPRGSQLGAWASRQSAAVPDRESLERALEEAAARFAGREIPLPPAWGGYRLRPRSIEFWQGGANRLHDRLLYTRQDAEEAWRIERLSP